MEAIKTELGGSWKIFFLSIPLDVLTFLFLALLSGGLAWQHLGETWGKSAALLFVTSGMLFALYYIFLRRRLLENLLTAFIYLAGLGMLTVILFASPLPIVLVLFIVLCLATYRRNSAHAEDGSDITRTGYDIIIPTDKIYSNINGVYVQQFLANVGATFQAYRALYRQGKISGIPDMISAYPRRRLESQLSARDIRKTIESAIKGTALDTEMVNEYLDLDLDAFLRTQREAKMFGHEKVKLRKVADEMERNHPEFYRYRPLHYEDLRRISEAEGLEVIKLKDLKVLAGLITYTSTEGEQKYAILMRDDESVHQALREFALAHELGHWFAHIKGSQPEKIEELNIYLSSLHDLGQFEDEANKVALITLFPAPYLSQCEVNKMLDAQSIFAQYLGGMKDTEQRDPGPQLRDNMISFIDMRIENYQEHRLTWLQQIGLFDRPLRKEGVGPLANHIGSWMAWAELNDNYIVVNANDKFAGLVGLTREELLESKIDVRMLSTEETRSITSAQLEEKRKDLTPKCYVTNYANLKTKKEFPVTIFAYPIVEGAENKYIGSFGIVTAIHRNTDNSN